MTTSEVAKLTSKSATSGGNVTDDGGSDVTITDIDGNVYQTVRIGDQVWMAENLKTTRFADGTNIPEYFWYDNNVSNKDVYGALYDWYTTMNLDLPSFRAVGELDDESAELEYDPEFYQEGYHGRSVRCVKD